MCIKHLPFYLQIQTHELYMYYCKEVNRSLVNISNFQIFQNIWTKGKTQKKRKPKKKKFKIRKRKKLSQKGAPLLLQDKAIMRY